MNDASTVNILIVDDRPDKLLALEAVLEELGENIVCVDSGREALRQLLKHEFAVILLDVNMPAMDGFETAQLIRQRPNSAGTPIIFLTAMGDDMHVARSYSLGAVDYILTPVVAQVLKSKVSVFVDLFKKTQQVRLQADRLRQRATQLHQLTTASIAINSAPSVEKIIEIATETARHIIEAHQAITLTILGRYAKQPPNCASYSQKYSKWHGMTPKLENPALRAVLNGAGKPLRMIHVELETLVPPAADSRDAPPLRGLLAAPLTGRNGGQMGTLLVSDKFVGDFTDDDQAVLIQLAQMASVAVENVIFAAEREDHRVKEEFLSTLSHELRTPLTAISGWVQLLRRDPSGEELAHGMEVIERNVHAQTRLIEDLLDLSRISTNKLRVSRRNVLVGPLLEGAVDAIRPATVERQINLECDFGGGNSVVSGDPDRLQQVFGNLLSNAMKFTPAGGTISVASAANNGEISIKVKDSGDGISPDFLPYIFDRFRQADSTISRLHGGLGIGLTIVRHLVELHRGTVRAESGGKGCGATFTVILPVMAAGETPARARSDAAAREIPSIKGVRVLVVDDDADTREVVAQILHRCQAAVSPAASAREAMRLLAGGEVDVLVTDLAMPEEDGYALLRAIRESSSMAEMPAIALTAHASGEDRHRALTAGFGEHLSKPVNPRELVEAIWRLGRRAMNGNGAINGSAIEEKAVLGEPESAAIG